MEENQNEETMSTDINYIEAIKEMKLNTVSKDKYEKVVAENKELVKAMAEGREIDTKDEPKVDVNSLRANYFKEDQSNLEYWENTLALRSAIIEGGGVDPFLPSGHEVAITQDDVDSANRVADVVEQCISQANGDSNVFTQLLQSRTNDTTILKKGK